MPGDVSHLVAQSRWGRNTPLLPAESAEPWNLRMTSGRGGALKGSLKCTLLSPQGSAGGEGSPCVSRSLVCSAAASMCFQPGLALVTVTEPSLSEAPVPLPSGSGGRGRPVPSCSRCQARVACLPLPPVTLCWQELGPQLPLRL